MHLNKILEQIKRHQSPSEAIDKLSTALEKHEGSLLEKGFTILKSELAANKNIPVVKADSSPLTGSEIAAGNRYFIYYNKCDNVMQVMNHYPTAAPAA